MNFSRPSFPSLLHCDLCCCCVYVNILIDSSRGLLRVLWKYRGNTLTALFVVFVVVVLWIMMTSGGCWSLLWSPFVNNHGSHLSPPATSPPLPGSISNPQLSVFSSQGGGRRVVEADTAPGKLVMDLQSWDVSLVSTLSQQPTQPALITSKTSSRF